MAGVHELSRTDTRRNAVRAQLLTKERPTGLLETVRVGRTLESRVVLGLYLCGEMLDVEGRLGGFNFQWSWSSGTVAGKATVRNPSA